MESSDSRLVLVDGYAQIYRAFFAIPSLADSGGAPTNALYGVTRFLLGLDQAWPHRFAAFVLDKGAPRQRLDLLPEYKANRPPMPEAMRVQVEPIRAWVEACGYPVLEKPGFEADDLIAGIVSQNIAAQTLIVSHDKDLGQLVGCPGVVMLIPGKGGTFEVVDEAEVETKFGVPCRAVRDWLALVGDTADNIPGVPGVGAKTAASLLAKFGSVDKLLANLGEVSPERIRKAIGENQQRLRDNLKLVALIPELPDGWTGSGMIVRREPDWERLLDMAEKLGFKSLLKTLKERRLASRNPMLF